jgi:hypothetical protein
VGELLRGENLIVQLLAVGTCERLELAYTVVVANRLWLLPNLVKKLSEV